MFGKKPPEQKTEEESSESPGDYFSILTFYIAPDGTVFTKIDWPEQIEGAKRTQFSMSIAQGIQSVCEGALMPFIKKAVSATGQRHDPQMAASILSQLPEKENDDDKPCVSAEDVFAFQRNYHDKA